MSSQEGEMLLLISSGEDGINLAFIDPLAEFNPEDHGIKTFYSEVPKETDPAYWPEDEGLLIKFKIATPIKREVVTQWEIK